jgi:two-component system, cell cycle sensor histidine kinase and response regulator CckA
MISMPQLYIQDIFNNAPIGIFTSTPEGRIISANVALVRMFGYESPEELTASITDSATQLYADPADRGEFIRLLEEHGEVLNHECRFRRRNGTEFWATMNVRAIQDEDGRIFAYQGFIADITEQKRTGEKLKRIEWMLSGKPVSNIDVRPETQGQGYGDLSELNRDGIILKSTGRKQLENLTDYYLELLGTSSAIYEANGDYAFGIFTSGWCRMLGSASRRLCNTSDNTEALNSGRWLCHESCWTDCAKQAIAECAPVDIECNGGLRMYAVPILAHGNVVGAINFGYSDPSTEPEQLRKIAEAYQLDYDDVAREAGAYDSRPPFIIELAKKRLHATARLIGAMVETQQAEEALEAQYALLRIAGETAGFGGWSVDLDNNICTWSDAVADIYDVPRGHAPTVQEAIGFYAPEWREKSAEVFTACAQKGVPYDEEMEIITSKGARVWVRTTGKAVQDEKGAIIKVQGSFQDITERKHTEQALVEQKDLLAAIYRNAPLVMMVVNAEGRIQQVNEFAVQFFNRDMEEMLGLRSGEALRCMHALDDPRGCGLGDFCRQCVIRNTVLDTLNTGTMHLQIEAPFYFKVHDNETRELQFLLSTTPIEVKGERMVLVSLQDITERRHMEKELQQDREHMDHILRATRTNMNTLDAEYNLRQVDEVWREIYGDPEGRKCHEYFMDRDTPCAGCGVPRALATREIKVTEEFLPKENRHIEVHTIPFQAENGEWLVTEFNLDITERKRAEAEKEKLQSQFLQAQKMESVGRLAGGVAHDFNNMLSVIIGHAEMALKQIGPGQPLFDALQEIRKAAERSANLTRQLLTFARKQTIAPRIIDLNETVEGMLKMLSRLIGEDIDLAWLPGDNLSPVKVDSSQIDHILANLCVNARDAIKDVGKITIETDVASFDEAYCAVHAGFVPGEYVLLAVSDNGCGMDSDTISHLFEPFFTTKEQGKGTGLGLASVYGAVKQNNGFINVYSEPGQGTTIKVYLPQYHARTRLQADTAPPEPTERGNATILLVEDEPALLSLATTMLEALGYVVIAAATPGEAIRLAHEHSGHIDLLMTDVVMPEMNGRVLAKTLLSTHPDIKRLFMSGYTADVIAHHGVLDEGVSFIQKPFFLKDLSAKLREVLQDKHAD